MRPREIQRAEAQAVDTLAALDQRRALMNRVLVRPSSGEIPFDVRLWTIKGEPVVAWRRKGLPAEVAGQIPPEPNDFETALRAAIEMDSLERTGGNTVFDGVLEDFTGLANAADDDAFLQFSVKHGPLQLCANHRLPIGHPIRPHYLRPPSPAEFGWCMAAQCSVEEEKYRYTPISIWRHEARRLDALRSIAAAVTHGRCAAPDLWRELGITEFRGWMRLGELSRERFLLQKQLDGIVGDARLQPQVGFNAKGEPSILLKAGAGSDEMYAALCRELLLEVAGLSAVRVCANCGKILSGKYRRRYCRDPECCVRAANRAAQRKFRQRSGEAGNSGRGSRQTRPPARRTRSDRDLACSGPRRDIRNRR
jgi:hypothetical protein